MLSPIPLSNLRKNAKAIRFSYNILVNIEDGKRLSLLSSEELGVLSLHMAYSLTILAQRAIHRRGPYTGAHRRKTRLQIAFGFYCGHGYNPLFREYYVHRTAPWQIRC